MTEGYNVREIVIADAFEDFVNDWDYTTYLSVGGYGSGKSHHTAIKIVLKALKERRKILVARETYESIKESCFELIKDILSSVGLLEENNRVYESRNKVIYNVSPMQFKFPNGSRIIFLGLDKPTRAKSIHGVSIVWFEEITNIRKSAYKEIVLRVRPPRGMAAHFILTCNPVGVENWVYKEFFVDIDDKGNKIVKQDDRELYKEKILVTDDNVYMLHTVVTDNPYVGDDYIKRLDDTQKYDEHYHRVARLGQFGVAGKVVLPQFRVVYGDEEIETLHKIMKIPQRLHFTGFDFGFEESYNAVVRMAVDERTQTLYIYDEIYENHVTDKVFCERPFMLKLKKRQQIMDARGIEYNPIVADSSSPKDIKYYQDEGFKIRKCKNRGMGANAKGTRIQNTKKMKRFKQIICLSRCVSAARELSTLTYKVDKNDEIVYDQFNIDPHTFSAMWYGLDDYNVADLKRQTRNSWYAEAA